MYVILLLRMWCSTKKRGALDEMIVYVWWELNYAQHSTLFFGFLVFVCFWAPLTYIQEATYVSTVTTLVIEGSRHTTHNNYNNMRVNQHKVRNTFPLGPLTRL